MYALGRDMPVPFQIRYETFQLRNAARCVAIFFSSTGIVSTICPILCSLAIIHVELHSYVKISTQLKPYHSIGSFRFSLSDLLATNRGLFNLTLFGNADSVSISTCSGWFSRGLSLGHASVILNVH